MTTLKAGVVRIDAGGTVEKTVRARGFADVERQGFTIFGRAGPSPVVDVDSPKLDADIKDAREDAPTPRRKTPAFGE